MANDERVGYWGEKPIYPKVSISGKPYTRPATTRDIGGGRFVVIDVFPSVDVDAEIRRINAEASEDTAELPKVEEDEDVE